MNQYLKNLSRIEFMVTLACTGRCKHCSEGEHGGAGEHIDAETTIDHKRIFQQRSDENKSDSWGVSTVWRQWQNYTPEGSIA